MHIFGEYLNSLALWMKIWHLTQRLPDQLLKILYY